MKYIFCAVAIVVAFIIWIKTIIWARMDNKRQTVLVAGADYRKEFGAFDIMKYALGNVASIVSNRQKNNGPDPKTYDKVIPFVDHFDTLIY